jgi:hypothetical protein
MCCIVAGNDPITSLTALFILFTNPLVAFMTLRPVSFAALRTARLTLVKERSPNPLVGPPPASAAGAGDPLYWATLQHRSQVPGGRPDIVDQASQRASGRHARQEAPAARAGVTA